MKKIEKICFVIFVIIIVGIFISLCVKDNDKADSKKHIIAETSAEETDFSEETEAASATAMPSESINKTTSEEDNYIYSLPDSVYDELAEKSGISRKALDSETRELKRKKGYITSAPVWDDSEKSLTDKQLKEIEAEKASIDAEKAAENSKTTQTNTENNTKEEGKND